MHLIATLTVWDFLVVGGAGAIHASRRTSATSNTVSVRPLPPLQW